MNKTARLAIAGALVALAGCGSTSGRIGNLPAIDAGSASAKVVVVRVSSIIGAANGYIVALDGQDLFGIGSGEYTEFAVPAGEHYIAVKCFGGFTPTWKEDALKFSAQASDKAHFEISPNAKCAQIRPVSEAETKKVIQESRFLNLDKPANK